MQQQPVTLVGSGDRKHSFISAGDVVAYTVAAIGNPRALYARLVIGGPEPLSLREAANLYAGIMGYPAEVRIIAPGEPVPGLPESMWPMLAGFGMFDTPIDMTETA